MHGLQTGRVKQHGSLFGHRCRDDWKFDDRSDKGKKSSLFDNMDKVTLVDKKFV